jgi:hypothetical protein
MFNIEWVSLYLAVARLENLWRISRWDAEQIVRNVVESGKAEVRGAPPYQTIFKVLTGQIRLSSYSLSTADYANIEIDWHGLLEHGRMLVPSDISTPKRRVAQNRSRSSEGSGRRKGPVPGTIDRYNDEAST